MSARRTAAVRRARAATRCVPGMCLRTVRGWLGVGPRYSSARAAWAATPAQHRHTHGTPPAGVPVFWSGRSGLLGRFGHVALSLGDGTVRSTDYPRRGQVGTVAISKLSSAWGGTYLGYATRLNGRDV